MKAIQEKLPGAKFIRVHRSFIICIKKVKSVRNNCIEIGEISIPIGRTYKDVVGAYLKIV
jgi:two-component system, LytTR family, response regulator LytT